MLVFFHGGVLWLGNITTVNVKLIAIITDSPFAGMDPAPLLRKDQEVTTIVRMKEKYVIVRDNRGF